jgi:superfamily II DNA or RNA helicase
MSSLNKPAPAPEAMYAPGLRVEIRDAEWVIRRADLTPTGGYSLLVTGISEIVRGRDARFLTEIDRIEHLHPEDTKLVPDDSPQFSRSRLYLESLLRQSPPTGSDLWIGYNAAMDVMPYQLEPALQALGQIRHRILIADAVGLGKTIEVGILLAELIRRGKGKRILVVTTKSMMTQFQAELWSRFTIPLVRLDRAGIERIREDIPTDGNPFDYYDKTIISVDTLKNERAFSEYIKTSHWDIIVVDEAHNVAVRGSRSARAKLAQLLAGRSDTLILASATPHDGKPESFASLMNMLNPTAIADPSHYTKNQVEGLFLRRFKKDVQEQIGKSFLERKTSRWPVPASSPEETAFDLVTEAEFKSFDQTRQAGRLLFRTFLEKALFSSPAACRQTIEQRMKKLQDKDGPDAEYDRNVLRGLQEAVEAITPKHFSKYQELLRLLKPGGTLGWNPSRTDDRLVIFTERVETLRFLRKQLQEDLKLKPEQITTLHGQGEEGDDAKLQDTVRNFGREQEPVRLLIASDIASEGINLHFLSHKLIHFDIPWSLMVFQQRNGRVDRYGQEKQPHIAYLYTTSLNKKIRGDQRILDILSEKDQKAQENIGDPSAFQGVYDQNEQELQTGKAIESGQAADEFERQMEENAQKFDLLSFLSPEAPPAGETAEQHKRLLPSLYPDDMTFVLEALKREDRFDFDHDPERKLVALTMPKDLQRALKRAAPKGSLPEDDRLLLTTDRKLVQREIDASRKRKSDGQDWPQIHLLWDLHPAVEWLNYKLLVKFARAEAPVLTLRDVLQPQEIVFLMQGEIPNRKGQPVVHSWFGVRFCAGEFRGIEELSTFLERTQFHRREFANPNLSDDATRETTLLAEAVEHAHAYMSKRRAAVNAEMEPKLEKARQKLAQLRGAQQTKLEDDFRDGTGIRLKLKQQRQHAIDHTFKEHEMYVRETLTTEDAAFLRVAAVFRGE